MKLALGILALALLAGTAAIHNLRADKHSSANAPKVERNTIIEPSNASIIFEVKQ